MYTYIYIYSVWQIFIYIYNIYIYIYISIYRDRYTTCSYTHGQTLMQRFPAVVFAIIQHATNKTKGICRHIHIWPNSYKYLSTLFFHRTWKTHCRSPAKPWLSWFVPVHISFSNIYYLPPFVQSPRPCPTLSEGPVDGPLPHGGGGGGLRGVRPSPCGPSARAAPGLKAASGRVLRLWAWFSLFFGVFLMQTT